MSNAYIFQAAMLCEACGLARLAETSTPDMDSEESDRVPQGPYSDGGGEADSPQHCDHCQAFLENPLTGDGMDYVRECVERHQDTKRDKGEVLRTWCEFYGISMNPDEDEDEDEEDEDKPEGTSD